MVPALFDPMDVIGLATLLLRKFEVAVRGFTQLTQSQ